MFVSVRQGTPDQRLDAWRHYVSEMFGPTGVHGVDRWVFRSGDISAGGIGSLVVAQVSADPTVVSWTAKAAAAAPQPDFFKVKVQVSGSSVVEQHGRQALLKPGDLALFDARRPYRFAYQGRYRAVFIKVPITLLPLDSKSLEQAGVVPVPGQAGVGALVSAFLTQLGSQLRLLQDQDKARLSDHVVDLLTTMFAQRLDCEPGTRRTALRKQAGQYIEQHLSDPELTPATIAAAHYVSTRYLHKVFQREGITVAGLIRARRLEKIRRDLADPLLAGRPVSEVGARWGLTSASQVSRLFRDAYGISPREYRMTTAAGRLAVGRGGKPHVPGSAA